MEQEINKEKIVEIVQDLLQRSGLAFSKIDNEIVEGPEGSTFLAVKVFSEEDCSLFLGKQGENLKALEHLARLLISKNLDQRVQFILDINDYRKERTEKIVRIAKEVADRVKLTQRSEVLFPMPAYERRMVHLELASCDGITTESIGMEPKRRVVIRPN